MTRALKYIIIIAIVAMAAYYFYNRSILAPPPPDVDPEGNQEDTDNDVITQTQSDSVPANPANSPYWTIEIDAGQSSVFAHMEYFFKWRGVTKAGVVKYANYDWSDKRHQLLNGTLIDILFDHTENGARFVIAKIVGVQTSTGFIEDDGANENVWLMAFDASLPFVPNNQLSPPSSIHAIKYTANTDVITVVKAKPPIGRIG